MPTYLDRILAILPRNETVEFDEILRRLNVPVTKTTHVIGAIKKGIETGVIIKIEQVGITNLYVGHLFRRV
jgi:hypothetical protein